MTDRADDPEVESAQAIVDALSVAIGRPVLLDDGGLVPIAYSRQWGKIDGVRSTSILKRGVPKEVREELLAQGIAEATEIVRTPSDASLGMSERVCVPVRAGGVLFGYIWLLDPEGTLNGDDLDRARAAARRVASVLAGRGQRSVADEGALLGRLTSHSAEMREAAADDLATRGTFGLGVAPVVLCVVAGTSDGVEPTAGALHAVRRLSVGHAIGGSFFEAAAVLVSLDDPVVRTLHEDEIAEWVHEISPGGLVVGQSSPVSLDRLPDAARQARIALRAARARSHGGRFAAWATLGADRLLAQLPTGWRADLPESLRRLLHERSDLATTLATFLEAGGDVKATAEAMVLHRSGVYYRLRRIEELTGLDLASGDDRLLAHLAIRADRISGELSSGATG